MNRRRLLKSAAASALFALGPRGIVKAFAAPPLDLVTDFGGIPNDPTAGAANLTAVSNWLTQGQVQFRKLTMPPQPFWITGSNGLPIITTGLTIEGGGYRGTAPTAPNTHGSCFVVDGNGLAANSGDAMDWSKFQIDQLAGTVGTAFTIDGSNPGVTDNQFSVLRDLFTMGSQVGFLGNYASYTTLDNFNAYECTSRGLVWPRGYDSRMHNCWFSSNFAPYLTVFQQTPGMKITSCKWNGGAPAATALLLLWCDNGLPGDGDFNVGGAGSIEGGTLSGIVVQNTGGPSFGNIQITGQQIASGAGGCGIQFIDQPVWLQSCLMSGNIIQCGLGGHGIDIGGVKGICIGPNVMSGDASSTAVVIRPSAVHYQPIAPQTLSGGMVPGAAPTAY